MSNSLKWYAIDKEYVEYLKRFDNRIQHINYDSQFKPYIGIILNISNFDYYVPISSVGNKPSKIKKYTNMKEDIDLFKIFDKNHKLLSILNINNMIPISKENAEKINYSDIEKYRNFKSQIDKKRYIYFLQVELSIMRRSQDYIIKKASRIYDEKFKNPSSRIALRTVDFDKIEEKCIEYGRVQTILPLLNYISDKEDLYFIYDNLNNQEDFEETVQQLDTPTRCVNIQSMSRDEINNILTRQIINEKSYNSSDENNMDLSLESKDEPTD